MESDDKFLHDYRRDPASGFARRLRERLLDEEETRTAPAWRPFAFAVATAVVVAALFAFPAVRAGAQALLDLFRVRSFVAVPFDEQRIERLRALDHDNAMLVFDKQQVIQEPGQPVIQSSPAAASAMVGFGVATPGYLPDGMALDTVAVTGEGRVRLSVSTGRLRDLLAKLDLRDVQVPSGLDGQEIDVHVNPVVSQRYRAGNRRLTLLQARSPEVSLPAGVDLAQLGELGLRVLGLDPGEARRIASTVDWRTTLMVPVPVNASSFRSVTVQGHPGLLVTTEERQAGDQRRRSRTLVLWADGDRVFALQGTPGPSDMIQVAESVR